MRHATGTRLLVCTVALSVVLAGCAAGPVRPPPTATTAKTATDAPVFASDADALAAATTAYAAYQSISDLILAEGGVDPDRIRKVTSMTLSESEIAGFNEAKKNGFRSVGASSFANAQIQRVSNANSGVAIVTIYLCSDVSRVDILNATGASVVPQSRPNRTPFEVTFDRSSSPDRVLVVGSRSVWPRGGVC